MDISTLDKGECLKDGGAVCMPKKVVHAIADIFEINDGDTIKKLTTIKNELNCDSESCVLTHVKLKNKGIDTRGILDEFFKAEGPRNSIELLSNFNIDDVLENYRKKFPKFYHVNYQTIDFAEHNTELATINFVDMLKNKEYDCLGVVLNTDVSTGPGKHWFALFVDMRKSPITFEFFNSSGRLPVQEMQIWLIEKVVACRKEGVDAENIIASKIQHQKKDTECGPYALFYIWSRLNNVPVEVFEKRRITDEEMIEFRKVIFREN